MGFENVGLAWSLEAFGKYLQTLARPSWAKAVCLHYTASPSLSDRPDGLSTQHVINLRDYYADECGWPCGPHLFVDDHKVHGMSPLEKPGRHASSFNKFAFGIEVLGEYDSEDPLIGRGLACWQNATAATRMLLEWIGQPANSATVLFHREGPKTKKTCPGRKVKKEWVLGLVNGNLHFSAKSQNAVNNVQKVLAVQRATNQAIAEIGLSIPRLTEDNKLGPKTRSAVKQVFGPFM